MRILLLNPNSSPAMTSGMLTAAQDVALTMQPVQIDSYKAPPASPASINNDKDIASSTEHVLQDLQSTSTVKMEDYDAILVACFSVHSLVPALLQLHPQLPVIGIFEASILTALSLISSPPTPAQWGIVTTGEFWQAHLTQGVHQFLGQERPLSANQKFAGVYSTGLTAGDFHTVSEEEVRQRLQGATKKLLGTGNVTCVVMGCGGMAGLEDIIRSVAVDAYGPERAKELYIIDGVKAGVMQLHQMVSSQRAFRKRKTWGAVGKVGSDGMTP